MRTADILNSMQTRRAVQRSQEQIISVMENLQEAIEDDLKSWRQVDGKPTKEPAFEDIPTLRQASQKAYYRNAHGKGLIGTMMKFVIGAGIIIDFSEKDEVKLKSLVSWFKKFKRNIRWFSFLKEIVRRLFRDGEVFLHKIPVKNKPLTFKFIDPAYILDDGIERDKNDAETTIKYTITPGNGVNSYSVDAKDMIHIPWDSDRNMKRGRPFLEVQFPLLTKLDKWIDARIVLSIIRTNVALVREVQGSPMDLARIRSTQQTQRSTGTETNKAKMLRPGSILSSTPGVKWSMLSPNLDARDASEDGKMLKLGMAAGAGLPDVFVTGDFSNSNFACHSEDTEILTSRGWIQFNNLTYEDNLATQNPTTGDLEFQKAEKLHSFPYSGDLYVYEGKRTNFAVTPNHEMVVAHYQTTKKQFAKTGSFSPASYKKIQIQELGQSKFYLLPIRVNWEGKFQKSFVMHSGFSVDMDLWLEFIGYAITDGCITDSKPCVEIGQESGWKAEKIERCVRKLQLPFRKTIRPSRGEWAELTIFHIGNNDLRKFLCEIVGTGQGSRSWQKHLPDFIWDLSSVHLHCLLDALIFGDGGEYKRHPGSTQRVFNTTSQKLGDDVQRLALMLGFATKLSLCEPMSSYKDGYERHRMFRIHIGDGHPQILKSPLLRKEPYEGLVWCATVPNGTLITRRDGKPLISGNSTVVSQNPAIRLFEDAQNFISEYIYNIVELTTLDGIAQGKITAKVTEDEDGEKTYDIDTDFEVRFPPMLKRDLAQETNAYKVLNEMGVMSKRTVALLSGLNPDQEFEQLDEELKNGQGPAIQPKANGLANGAANGNLSTDPTISHRKALAPKTPAERKPRQNVAAK